MEMRVLPKSMDYYLDRYDQVVLRIFEEELEIQPGARRLVDGVRARGCPWAWQRALAANGWT